jgi:hypothetical protein
MIDEVIIPLCSSDVVIQSFEKALIGSDRLFFIAKNSLP